jgi:metal-responsive CopG/Arc/MetJ family transcriptional regulator
MRLHISLRDEVVEELDRRAGLRGRSAYIARAVEAALDDDRRWDLIESAVGTLAATGHEWDDDPAEWVRAQRRADDRRVG